MGERPSLPPDHRLRANGRVDTEPWASVEDVAKHLGIAKDTVYRWIEKALPAHKIGRLWKFKFSEVDEWVRQGGAQKASPMNTPVEEKSE